MNHEEIDFVLYHTEFIKENKKNGESIDKIFIVDAVNQIGNLYFLKKHKNIHFRYNPQCLYVDDGWFETTRVQKIVQRGNMLIIHTKNSVYTFKIQSQYLKSNFKEFIGGLNDKKERI